MIVNPTPGQLGNGMTWKTIINIDRIKIQHDEFIYSYCSVCESLEQLEPLKHRNEPSLVLGFVCTTCECIVNVNENIRKYRKRGDLYNV